MRVRIRMQKIRIIISTFPPLLLTLSRRHEPCISIRQNTKQKHQNKRAHDTDEQDATTTTQEGIQNPHTVRVRPSFRIGFLASKTEAEQAANALSFGDGGCLVGTSVPGPAPELYSQPKLLAPHTSDTLNL